jgi:RNA polymerase sigma-70 factor (ECF subfamily)
MTDAEIRSAFHQYQDPVYRFAWRMTGTAEAAEDIAQETFLVLLRRPDAFNPGQGELRPFLFGVARNLALKFWRQQHRWTALDEETFLAEPLDPSQRETAALVADAVRALPPFQREALIMAEYEELSLEEIALAVEAEVGTVKSRLYRARENLRRMLAPLRESRSTYGTAK